MLRSSLTPKARFSNGMTQPVKRHFIMLKTVTGQLLMVSLVTYLHRILMLV
ncbi:unnamed protein product [Linum tenue]|uniref:Uncharacterized protein n=1 Tax=Linum tenue TaxID=586396 RepID=A0AAV0NSY3_9ROSI|nr:unnamed protein product [Linum tenue]